MAKVPVESAPADGYAAQLDTLRSVAKWLVAAFAGVGALLVAGLSISGIGQLSPSSWRLYIAGGSAALALATVAFMIKEASIVLTHEWLTLASFSDEPTGTSLADRQRPDWRSAQLRDIDSRLRISRHELFGYAAESRPQLHARLRQADERLWRARPGSRSALKAAREASVLRKAARDTAQYANYYYTLKLFQRMRARLGWGALVTAISVGIFAYAASPPHVTSPPAKAGGSFHVAGKLIREAPRDRGDISHQMPGLDIKSLHLGMLKIPVINEISVNFPPH
jgi:hypothetical protein